MNYIKVQQEIIKDNAKPNAVKLWSYGVYEYEKNNYIGVIPPEAYFILLIPNDKFYLDVNKTFKGEPLKIERMLDFENACEATKSNIVEELPIRGKECKARLFLTEKDDEIYINEKLFNKYFDTSDEFRAGKDIIYCFEYAKPVGIILAIRNPN